ncbi:hypothetical protein [Taibaiella koreensis]|uniref:hypothetical protein n=1 Tax=Taibaiella koreensis TaxID=1268548 RepID=UPI000E59F979|nr:hypothetical protein [Taibaiella koreensis]
MKKLFSALLPLCFLFLAHKANAFGHYEYCKATVQTTSDSWNVYINRQLVGGSAPPALLLTEYRITTTYRNGTVTVGSWTTLPSGSSVPVGTSGMGAQITTIEIRVPSLSTITVLSPC